MKIINMKKYFVLFCCLFTIAFSSCRKVVTAPFDASVQAETDDKAIQDYFLLNGITGVKKDASGLYYNIDAPGTGAHPTLTSGITVAYKEYLLDGTLVDSATSYYFSPLSSLIQGWRIGLPMIGTGGKITLYIPSGLAYGIAGSGPVASNSVLIFNITLQGFTN